MTVNVSKPAINVREKLAELDKPTGIAGEAMLRAETPQEQFQLIGAGRRNILINGDFQVWQRGTSWTGAPNLYTADRWKTNTVGVTATYEKTTDDTYKITTTSSSGSGTARIFQIVENDMKKFVGKAVTVSAYVKSNSPNARLEVYSSAWRGFESVHSGGGAWERLEVTFIVPSGIQANGFSVQVGIDGYNSANVSMASGEYVEIKEVQLELGKVATPFEHRSYGEELALCQRYYHRLGKDSGSVTHLMVGAAEGTAVYVVSRGLPTEMRSVPSVTIGSGVRGFTTSAGIVSVTNFSNRCSTDIACISANVSGTTTLGQAAVLYDSGANGYIELDAEL